MARILIRPPEKSDQDAFLAAVQRSRRLHRSWVRAPQTPEKFQEYLSRLDQQSNWSFLVCLREGGELAGVITVSNAVRGYFQSAYLGYYAFAGCERQGYMREGLQAVLRYAFRTLKLHRLEANIQPGNLASIALVRACGFEREGYSRAYLKIAGRWRDHERWAIVSRPG